ncbi:MAG: PAS domain S-box protein [bacterium]|nr:PAS domain S-box protein [bacterium]
MKLQYKISLLVFGFGLVFLGGIESLSYYFTRIQHLNDVNKHLLESALNSAERVELTLEDKANVALALSNAPIISKALFRSNSFFGGMTEDERKKEIKRLNDKWIKTVDLSDPFISSYMTNPVSLFLKEHMDRNPGKYGEIFITNRYGTIIATTGKLTTLAHSHKYWWVAAFAEGDGRVFFDDRGFDASVSGYVIGVTVPIMKDGDIIGIMKCNVNMDAILLDEVQAFKLGKTGALKVTRSGGMVVREKGKAVLSTRVPGALVEEMGDRGTGTITINGLKKASIYAYAPIPITSGTPQYGFGGKGESIDHIKGNRGELWYVLLSQELSEALAPLREELRRDTFAGLFIVIIMGLLSLVIGKRVSLPVMKMEAMARRVGRGDFDVEMDVRSRDELGSLANSFNEMTRNLRETTTSVDKLSREVSERRKAEEKLRSILVAAGDGIIVASADSRIVIVNEDLCNTFGYLEEELVGRDVEMLMPEKYRKAHGDGMKRYLESGAAKVLGTRIEIEGLRKDGSVFPIEIRIEETGEAEREKKVFVAAIRDISDRKQNEEKLKRYASNLEESNRVKDLFTDIMRHDLMNPAGVIMNSAEILYEEEDSESKRDIIRMIIDNSSQCVELIENASIYARIEHLDELEKNPIDLTALLKDIIRNFAFNLQEKDMTIIFDSGGECVANMNKMISEVFSNLISNAIKYGNKKSRIEINMSSDEGYLLLSVKDRGEGVPDGAKEKIFERFERAGVTDIKGTGLGLAIAKRIVDLHKGRIWVEDNPEGGSIFYVRIPEDGGKDYK